APDGPKPPPPWIRGLLVLTCTGVSFDHGSNDGQKGMGLIMLVLIGLIPATFALHLDVAPGQLPRIAERARVAQPVFDKGAGAARVDNAEDADRIVAHFLTTERATPEAMAALAYANRRIAEITGGLASIRDLHPGARSRLRRDIYVVDAGIAKLGKIGAVSGADAATLHQLRAE